MKTSPTVRSRRPTYKEAIGWIAANDDTEFLDDEDPAATMSVTLAMVRDLFDKTDEQVIADLKKTLGWTE